MATSDGIAMKISSNSAILREVTFYDVDHHAVWVSCIVMKSFKFFRDGS